jgi:hypothetical protein
MARYYFDVRDGGSLLVDEDGMELEGDEQARNEAVRGLADIVKDALPGALRRELAIEVRRAGSAVFSARVVFEVAMPQ